MDARASLPLPPMPPPPSTMPRPPPPPAQSYAQPPPPPPQYAGNRYSPYPPGPPPGYPHGAYPPPYYPPGGPGGMYGGPPPPGSGAYGHPVREAAMSLRVAIPTVCSGCVLGKGGSIIKELRAQSGSNISLADPESSAPNERVVTITGTPSAIATAFTLIREAVEKYVPPSGGSYR